MNEFVNYYHQNKDKLFSFLMYRLNFDKMLAEDMLQDIVLKAYDRFETFDPSKGSFTTWIFAIANNHLINYWRQNSKKETLSVEDLKEVGFEPEGDLSSQKKVAESLAKENVQNLLTLLKPEEKEVIVLRYINDFSYSEMAMALDKNEGAIRTQLSRALDRFKTYYEKLYG